MQRRALRGRAKAAVVPDASNPLGIEVLCRCGRPPPACSSPSVSPNVQLLDLNAPHPALSYFPWELFRHGGGG